MLNISRTRLLAGAAALALTASLGATPGLAETDTGVLNVQAQVDKSCSVGDVGTLNFEVITPGTTATTSTSFEVICGLEGNVGITLSGHSGGFWTMENGAGSEPHTVQAL